MAIGVSLLNVRHKQNKSIIVVEEAHESPGSILLCCEESFGKTATPAEQSDVTHMPLSCFQEISKPAAKTANIIRMHAYGYSGCIHIYEIPMMCSQSQKWSYTSSKNALIKSMHKEQESSMSVSV